MFKIQGIIRKIKNKNESCCRVNIWIKMKASVWGQIYSAIKTFQHISSTLLLLFNFFLKKKKNYLIVVLWLTSILPAYLKLKIHLFSLYEREKLNKKIKK